MVKILSVLSAALLVAAAGISFFGLQADACGDVNTADIVGRDVDVDQVGYFTFYVDAEWHLKSNPSWVVIMLDDTGQSNVKDVHYTPTNLYSQPCDVDNYTFMCNGYLTDPDEDGNVNTYFQAGLPPSNWAFDVEATFIPQAW